MFFGYLSPYVFRTDDFQTASVFAELHDKSLVRTYEDAECNGLIVRADLLLAFVDRQVSKEARICRIGPESYTSDFLFLDIDAEACGKYFVYIEILRHAE